MRESNFTCQPMSLEALESRLLLDALVLNPGVPLTFAGDPGETITVNLQGPGMGIVDTDALGNITAINLLGTTKASSLYVTVSGGTNTVGDVTVQGSLHKFVALQSTLQGNFDVANTARLVSFAGVADGSQMEIHSNPALTPQRGAMVSFSLGNVDNFTLNTNDIPIYTLTVREWVDSGGAGVDLTAPAILNRITCSMGVFGADVNLTGRSSGAALNYAYFLDNLTESDWDIAGNVNYFRVYNTASDSTISSTGNMDRVRFGQADGVNVLAGMQDGVTTPTVKSDFSANRRIKDVRVLGLAGIAGNLQPNNLFADSIIAAARIGTVALKNTVSGGVYAIDAPRTTREIQKVDLFNTATLQRTVYPTRSGQLFNAPIGFELQVISSTNTPPSITASGAQALQAAGVRYAAINLDPDNGNGNSLATILNAYEGKTVALNVTATDLQLGQVLTYTWVQTGGKAVVLAGANTAEATFVVPAISSSKPTAVPPIVGADTQADMTATFRVTVSDGIASVTRDLFVRFRLLGDIDRNDKIELGLGQADRTAFNLLVAGANWERADFNGDGSIAAADLTLATGGAGGPRNLHQIDA